MARTCLGLRLVDLLDVVGQKLGDEGRWSRRSASGSPAKGPKPNIAHEEDRR